MTKLKKKKVKKRKKKHLSIKGVAIGQLRKRNRPYQFGKESGSWSISFFVKFKKKGGWTNCVQRLMIYIFLKKKISPSLLSGGFKLLVESSQKKKPPILRSSKIQEMIFNEPRGAKKKKDFSLPPKITDVKTGVITKLPDFHNTQKWLYNFLLSRRCYKKRRKKKHHHHAKVIIA